MREAAETGGYAPGRPIVIIDEARRLGLSTTPVREALAWLCGEGVIERGPAGGFLARRLDAGAVRDRYGFRLACLGPDWT
ncbi:MULTISPECIES: GntR family transcriptional regulator [Brevundimonas]|nr:MULTISPECIES: GntR family transcriptional regulator [Brevundimonas]